MKRVLQKDLLRIRYQETFGLISALSLKVYPITSQNQRNFSIVPWQDIQLTEVNKNVLVPPNWQSDGITGEREAEETAKTL